MSTFTRPTSVSPTASCDRKVQLVESIDVGQIEVPKLQAITLASNFRRFRLSQSTRLESTSGECHRERDPNATDLSLPGTAPPSRGEDDAVQANTPSLTPSESGAESTRSESAESIPSSRRGVGLFSQRPSSKDSTQRLHPTEKAVTAAIELSRGGCLPGDVLSVKITVDHTKPIKSLHGIIVTLYRQCYINVKSSSSESVTCKGGGSRRAKQTTLTPGPTLIELMFHSRTRIVLANIAWTCLRPYCH